MKKLSTNNLEMLIKSDQQDMDRCERIGNTDGENNIPNQTSKNMSKFEVTEISKISKALNKVLAEKEKIESTLLDEKTKMLRKLDMLDLESTNYVNYIKSLEKK